MSYTELKEQSLSETADELETSGDYPPQPEPGYPLFPDALRLVEAADPKEKCINCEKPGYYYPADKAYAPGHCYSEEGRREFTSISSCCEFCFDHMFKEE